MASSPYVFDVSEQTFPQHVLDASHDVPVMVDFWAPWCGPCQALMPILTALADRYAGKFRLAKVNIDQQSGLATQFGVRSVPTVKIFRGGQMVDEFLGALPERDICAILDRHIERESDKLAARATEAWRAGAVEQAVAVLREAAAADPDNHRVVIQLAEILISAAAYEDAEALLKTLPLNVASEPPVTALRARLEFARIAQHAPELKALQGAIARDPDDSEARYQLSARYMVQGQYEAAMEQLLEIVRRDRRYGDDAGRKGLIKIFETLGSKGELVNRYRSLMSAALY